MKIPKKREISTGHNERFNIKNDVLYHFYGSKTDIFTIKQYFSINRFVK